MTVPLPPGAVYAYDWSSPRGLYRMVDFGSNTIEGVQVGVYGDQHRSGEVTDRAILIEDGPPLTASSARMVAAELLNRADELDAMAEQS